MKRTLIAALFAVLLASCWSPTDPLVDYDADTCYVVSVVDDMQPGLDYEYRRCGKYCDYYYFDEVGTWTIWVFMLNENGVKLAYTEGYR